MTRRPWTLARSLAVRVVAIAGAVLVLTSAANVLVLALVLDGRSDDQLHTSAAAVAQLTDDSRVEAIRVARLRALAPAGSVVVALGGDDVAVGLSSVAMSDADLDRVARAAEPGAVTRVEAGGTVYKVTAVDIRPLDVVTETGERRVPADRIVLGMDVSDEGETVAVMLGVAAGILALALAALAVAVTLAVRRATRPLSRMATSARRASTGESEARLDVEGSIETRDLAVAVNDALDARARLEARLRQFVADASHELRAPITTIQGWSELYLQGEHADGDAVATMERVEAETARMRALVDELALLARLDARVSGAREPVRLGALAAAVVDDARVVNPDRVVTLEVDGDPVVRGDESQLVRVLRNLVGNAEQHAGPDAVVAVTVAESEGSVELTVRDDGRGIADDALPHVFERFYVADRRAGSGLGLAIARSIVADHGGTVALDSRVGRGTVVRVELPRA
jgi:two-component system OmpR family sensor kinase